MNLEVHAKINFYWFFNDHFSTVQVKFIQYAFSTPPHRAVASSIIGGGGADSHIFVFTNLYGL